MTGNDNTLVFADEKTQAPVRRDDHWTVLIVDDEAEVHHVTKLVLTGFSFMNRPIRFLSAYSGAEARKVISENTEIAVVLLDVVMEDEGAGLALVKHIRDELKNPYMRIVLRTGQPGYAPEGRVIVEYDINDYKEKTELTAQKLFTTMVSAIRSYRDIMTIEKNRRGLEKIIDASAHIFEIQSLQKFASGILEQLTSLLNIDRDAIYFNVGGFTAVLEENGFRVLAATGRYAAMIGKHVDEILEPGSVRLVARSVEERRSLYENSAYVGYIETKSGSKNIIYLDNCAGLTSIDIELINIYCINVAVAFENIYLNRELEETQKELIFKLGEVIENRTQDTDTNDHVKRVAGLVRFLALKRGLSEDEAELVSVASAIHDIGKIAIPDSILLKPAKLSSTEFGIMKEHTAFGRRMFEHSKRSLFGAATVIAYQHHECWDGTGYPTGSAGEDIHVYARITSVADVFDALTHKRVYREGAFRLEEAVDYIRSQSGKQFDPELVEIFQAYSDEFAALAGILP
ncbi:MAG: DUF3369 domain-containing protein [Spirochaetes bacterium]|nr:DUF3369 domain-containing protein [Spirochaetota bacterium]